MTNGVRSSAYSPVDGAFLPAYSGLDILSALNRGALPSILCTLHRRHIASDMLGSLTKRLSQSSEGLRAVSEAETVGYRSSPSTPIRM